jgi:hypothetical protein
MYNHWFAHFAPNAFREKKLSTIKEVEETLNLTSNLTVIDSNMLLCHPEILPTLRMSTSPPLAVDRLIGLSGVLKNLVKNLEENKRVPPKMPLVQLRTQIHKLIETLSKMLDTDIFPWLTDNRLPDAQEASRAATIVADRLCGAQTNPIIRNAQERRQLEKIGKWLSDRGYLEANLLSGSGYDDLDPGTFAFRLNVHVKMPRGTRRIKIPIDVVVRPKQARKGGFPIFIEAKSAGDYTNVNKRRKEEAAKMTHLHRNFGKKICFVLFLCGYFDEGYIRYEASEGIDWIWEHRMDDMEKLGL